MGFMKGIKERAMKNPAIIGFPEIEDKRIVEAAIKLMTERVAVPVLIGDPKKVKVRGIRIIDTSTKQANDMIIEEYKKIREAKGKKVTPKEIKELSNDNSAKAMVLLHQGLLDSVITGSSNSTAHTLRWAFRIIGTKKGVKKASSYFIMCKGDDVEIFADCAVQTNPDHKELAEIAVQTHDSAVKIGLKPRIAMLSYSTKGSAVSGSVLKVRKATMIASKKINNIDGEIQFDAAVDLDTAKRKKADNILKGKANVFIFPCLESGNIAYKVMRIYGKHEALGPLMQGMNKQVHDLSRSVSVKEIIEISALVSVLR
ncbi:MAG: phosphate acyltransferase [Candidatus Woesearchaeota archaeon]